VLDGDEAAGALEARRALDGDEGPLDARRALDGDEPAGGPLEAHRELDADVRHEPSPKARRWLRDEAPHEEALHEDALGRLDGHALHEHALVEHTLARLTCSPEDALGPLLDAQRVLGEEACGPLG